jgi:hypothetical protein
MTEVIIYQSVIQKLGQLNPNDLSQLDAFLTALISQSAPKKKKAKTAEIVLSPIDCLEELAKSGGINTIENASEWQRATRQDRALPYR